jgi:hypothetical protein
MGMGRGKAPRCGEEWARGGVSGMALRGSSYSGGWGLTGGPGYSAPG